MDKKGGIFGGKSGRKAQVTIFILIAILIFAVLVVIFYPRIKVFFAPTEPVSYVEECINPEVENILEKVSMQGGSSKPSLYFAYQGNNVEYLCYTNQYYKTCIMQQPMLKQHIEREIKDYVEGKAKGCIQGLKDEMERRGYTVSSNYQGTDVQVVPNNINIIINAKVILTKEGTQSFNKFEVRKKSEFYDLIMLTTSILNLETRFGTAESTTYMFYYPDIRVEKLAQGDGSKVYILTNKGTEEKFMFATRSLSWPGGYKLRL
jgi:hypothetical protein